MTVDYLRIPKLTCRSCGAGVVNSLEQTHIAREQHHYRYEVGDRLDLPTTVEGFAGNDYIATRPERGFGRHLRVLESWWCSCEHNNVCVWLFEDSVFTGAECPVPSLGLIRGVDLVALEFDSKWVREALLALAPDEGDRIEWMTTTELVEAAVLGVLPDEDEDED